MYYGGTMKLKTLIIDDHPASISILKKMLREHCACFVATQGFKGIDIFERAIKKREPFEIVLLDIVMPDINGIDVLKRLRQIELENQDVSLSGSGGQFSRIIMQTSSEDPKDFISAFREGKCNGYITKPYSKKEIIDKVLGKLELLELTSLA